MPVFAFLGSFWHEVAVQPLRQIVGAVKAQAGDGCVVLCNTDGLFASASHLASQVDQLFESGIDLIFSGEQSIARSASRALLASDRWPILRPLNLPPTTPGNGKMLFGKSSEPIWLLNLLDGSGKIPVEPAHLVLEEFFRNKSDALSVLVHIQGNDYEYHKALAWKYRQSGHKLLWFGGGTGPLAASCELSDNDSFRQSSIGTASTIDSVGGMTPEIWWKRRIDKLPVPIQAGWGPWRCDYTLLWLDNHRKILRFKVDTINL